MCGRYRFLDDDNLDIINIIKEIEEKNPHTTVLTGDIFPADTAPILLQDKEKLKPVLSVWGFQKYKGNGVIINARSETVQEKKTFSKSIINRRCLIPSTGFYEWDAQKNKHLFQTSEEKTLYMAGIFQENDGIRRYVILTTTANDSMRDIHERMPVIVPESRMLEWVFDTPAALKYLHQPMPELYHT